MKLPSLPIETELGDIPRVIHQIWIGDHRPDWVDRLWHQWRAYGLQHGIEVRQWTDVQVNRALTGRVAGEHSLTPVQMADLFRIEVLCLQGGIYMDSDTVPLRPIDGYLGKRNAWLAHGQAWNSAGDPTVSNAMFGFPRGHIFLSDVFDHAVKAIERGVKRTFDLAGPTVYRRFLDNPLYTGIEVAPQKAFPAYRKTQKENEARLGRPLNKVELQHMYPGAVAVHLSAESWVEGKLEKRALS